MPFINDFRLLSSAPTTTKTTTTINMTASQQQQQYLPTLPKAFITSTGMIQINSTMMPLSMIESNQSIPNNISLSSPSSSSSVVPAAPAVSVPVTSTITNHEKINRLTHRLASSTGSSQSSSISLLEEIRDVCLSLGLNEQDYIIESEMQRLVEKITKYIKVNRELDEKIDEIDNNIGLLVRNSRLALSKEALAEMKQAVTTSNKSRSGRGGFSGGSRKWTAFDIGQFSRSYCSKLRCYSHLFYALQTQPRYLSRLLFAVPTFQVSSFFKNCIYSLFFCEDSGEREVYLLCRLLREALREEIQYKVTKASSIIDGDPVIVPIVLDCHRAHRQALFDRLKPVIMEILSHKGPFLCLDPVSLFKDRFLSSEADLSSLEDPCSKFQDITIEQALNDNQVRAHLAHNIPHVIRTCERLIDLMVSPEFIELIPFGLKYICKSLDTFLAEKSPNLCEPYEESDKIKVIANIIFSRWIRPCILFPEAYLTNFRELEKRTGLIARRNLNGVCKLIQAAVSGKKVFTFSPIAPQSLINLEEIRQLDDFLERSWFSLKRLVDSICWVDDIANVFYYNEFTDEARLKPPTVTLAFQEIMDAHFILHRYQNDIAPNSDDPIDAEFHQLIDDCGPPHQGLQTLLGCDPSYIESVGSDELLSVEATLRLRSRVINDIEVTSNATIKVKQALLELIKQRPNCKDLNQVLFRKVEDEENTCYILYKNSINWCLALDLKKNSVLFSPIGSDLCSLLDFAIQNMRHTEARNFDEILVMITQDIINKLQYRSLRYSNMINLESTLNSLLTKREHLQEINQYYEKYLNKCRASYKLTPALARVVQSNGGGSADSRLCFRYSAVKLKEKGILVSLGDCKSSQMKRIKFELSPSPESTLTIELRMLERDHEIGRIKLDLQYLLRLQYDGYKVINLLGKAHLNVNHLIYLINSKFYLRRN